MHLSTPAFSVMALTMLMGSVLSAAPSQRLVASPGWQLEFFGQDVAILRTTLTAPRSGRTGQILMSCDGSDRRVRIVLPEAPPWRPLGESGGMAMIKSPGTSATAPRRAISRFSFEADRALVFADTDPTHGDATLPLAGLLAALPARFELLIHAGRSPITIKRVQTYAVSLAFEPRDNLAFIGFIAACRPRSG